MLNYRLLNRGRLKKAFEKKISKPFNFQTLHRYLNATDAFEAIQRFQSSFQGFGTGRLFASTPPKELV
jgi:hypothetical protein